MLRIHSVLPLGKVAPPNNPLELPWYMELPHMPIETQDARIDPLALERTARGALGEVSVHRATFTLPSTEPGRKPEEYFVFYSCNKELRRTQVNPAHLTLADRDTSGPTPALAIGPLLFVRVSRPGGVGFQLQHVGWAEDGNTSRLCGWLVDRLPPLANNWQPAIAYHTWQECHECMRSAQIIE